jgi:hypothetical protein
VTPQFERAGNFSEGLAPVRVGGKFGYADPAGKLVVIPQFDGAEECFDGLARVAVGRKHGYIDQTGKYIWAPTNGAPPPSEESTGDSW